MRRFAKGDYYKSLVITQKDYKQQRKHLTIVQPVIKNNQIIQCNKRGCYTEGIQQQTKYRPPNDEVPCHTRRK